MRLAGAELLGGAVVRGVVASEDEDGVVVAMTDEVGGDDVDVVGVVDCKEEFNFVTWSCSAWSVALKP